MRWRPTASSGVLLWLSINLVGKVIKKMDRWLELQYVVPAVCGDCYICHYIKFAEAAEQNRDYPLQLESMHAVKDTLERELIKMLNVTFQIFAETSHINDIL